MDRKNGRQATAIVRLGLSIVACCMLSSTPCQAHTPTPEELCRQRNTASCEISGLKFFIEDDCPKGAKILRPKGKENCEQVSATGKTENKLQAGAAIVQSAPPADAEAAMSAADVSAGFLGSPYFFILIIGLLQGLISRAAWGPLITVLLVMPLIGTWVLLSGIPGPTCTGKYWGHAGMVLLQAFFCSMAGWGGGVALRLGVFKLPFR